MSLQKIDIPIPKKSDIKLIISQGKIEWLFKDKSEWIKSLGHEPNLKFVEYIKDKIAESYCEGKYHIRSIDKYGVRSTVYIDIEGNGEKRDKKYSLKSGFSIFSNGKLKCNTLIGGK